MTKSLAQPTSADRIRSKYFHKIGIDSTSNAGQSSNTLAATVTSTDSLMFEPLKVGLDSDDSSMDSSYCDDDSDYFFCHSTESQDYFHKEPHRPQNSVTANSSPAIEVHVPKGHPSVNSLPSLAGSSTGSSLASLYSSPIDSSSQIDSTICTLSTSCSSNSNKKARYQRNTKKKNKVSLDKSVSVVLIPSHTEYSTMVREKLWSSSAELCANAARNSVEFASEGWNWRSVIEDEGMLVHQSSGELIHPIHLHNALSCLSQPGEDDQQTLSLISGLVPNGKTEAPFIASSDEEKSTPVTQDESLSIHVTSLK